jgi:hypothetical protein
MTFLPFFGGDGYERREIDVAELGGFVEIG